MADSSPTSTDWPSIASGNAQEAKAGKACARELGQPWSWDPDFFFLLTLVTIGKPIIPMETQFPLLNNFIPRADFLGCFQFYSCLLVTVFHPFIYPSNILLTIQHCLDDYVLGTTEGVEGIREHRETLPLGPQNATLKKPQFPLHSSMCRCESSTQKQLDMILAGAGPFSAQLR